MGKVLEEKTSLRPGLGAAVYSLRVSVLPYMACLLSVPYCFLIVFVSLFYGYLDRGCSSQTQVVFFVRVFNL